MQRHISLGLIRKTIPRVPRCTMPADITSWASKDGHFRRAQSVFRDFVSNEPNATFAPEKGRYHLYVSDVNSGEGRNGLITCNATGFICLPLGTSHADRSETQGA